MIQPEGFAMNFRQLKAFNVVMRHGTITAAARELRVSQPSVTRLIHDLETALGFSLFVRQGRGALATMEARRFHQAVESAFINIEWLDELATAIRQDTIGKISIGVIPTFSVTVLPRILGRIKGKATKTHTVIHTRNTPGIVDAIQLQQFDLGIVSRSPPYEGVHILYHTSVNYVALIPAGHELAAHNRRPAASDEALVDVEGLALWIIMRGPHAGAIRRDSQGIVVAVVGGRKN